MKQIEEQILWYEENAESKDDELILADLQLINELSKKIENSEDRIFLDKIIATFCEIVEVQRGVIEDVRMEAGHFNEAPTQLFLAARARTNDFADDKALQTAFTTYCLENGKSSYTGNDYCSRIKNLWKSFYAEYRQGNLPDEIGPSEELMKENCPLLNAYHHTEELNSYIRMKITSAEGSRNWANTRAAFNKLDAFKLWLMQSV